MKTVVLLAFILAVTRVSASILHPVLPSILLSTDDHDGKEATNEEADRDSVLVRHKRQDAAAEEGASAIPDVPSSGGSLDIPPPLEQDPSLSPTLPPIPEPKAPTEAPLVTERLTEPPEPETERLLPTVQTSSRQLDGEPPAEELCEFGSMPDVNLCKWSNLNVTQLKWIASAGRNAYWLGGPKDDVTYGDALGGYAMFETSQIPKKSNQGPTFESAMLMSPVQTSTGATGMCVKFWYSISGLSPNRVRVLLHPMPADMKNDDNVADMMIDYDGSGDVVLWEARDMTMGTWKEGQVVYTFDAPHTVIFEGIPVDSNDLSRRFRGYIALDELAFAPSAQCGAFCTFEGGTCGWTQDDKDDFEWTQSRGSLNPSTGPPRDRSSFANNGMMGGYAFIDSSYPRRPGDRARLMSQEFQGTNPDSPLCMRFWTHMYGNGIGSLRVIIYDVNSKKDEVIWSITGEAGNAWYQGQVPIASPTPFKVSASSVELPNFKIVFEGVIGNNNLGDIAIDDISIVQGACPSAPQVAAGNNGDCTFEVDECGWTNPGPRERVDEMDWVRSVAGDNRAPARDHTIGTSQGFYMVLPRGSVQRGGDRAWLVSASIPGKDEAMCIAFWYFLYEPFIDPAGPSLGSLTLYAQYIDDKQMPVLEPVWSLKNHQGPNWLYGQAKVKSKKDFQLAFEGMWGSSRGNGYMALDDITLFMGDCSTMPTKATTMPLDCDFQRSVCQWTNTTTDSDFRWTTASISRRPANLPDHTFSGPVGYAYFDVFNQNARPQTLTFMSPPMEKPADNQPMCLTFWFAYFGAGDTTQLKVHLEPYDKNAEEGKQGGTPTELWSLVALNIGTQRPDWSFGQVKVMPTGSYRVAFVGMASNGGFAIDDVKAYQGDCQTRPTTAAPTKDGRKDSGTSDTGTNESDNPLIGPN